MAPKCKIGQGYFFLCLCRSANTMFDIVWLGRHVALQASNGKYVCTKKNGQLAAVSDSIGGCGHIPKQNCSRSN